MSVILHSGLGWKRRYFFNTASRRQRATRFTAPANAPEVAFGPELKAVNALSEKKMSETYGKGFAMLNKFDQSDERFKLKTGFIYHPETFLAGSYAKIPVRPNLVVNGFYAPLQKLVALQNASDAAAAAGAARPPPEVRQNALAAVVAGFVEDIECGVAYSAAEHLASQLSFVSAGHAERSHLDFQLRLNNVSADLERLRRVMRYRQPENASATSFGIACIESTCGVDVLE